MMNKYKMVYKIIKYAFTHTRKCKKGSFRQLFITVYHNNYNHYYNLCMSLILGGLWAYNFP